MIIGVSDQKIHLFSSEITVQKSVRLYNKISEAQRDPSLVPSHVFNKDYTFALSEFVEQARKELKIEVDKLKAN